MCQKRIYSTIEGTAMCEPTDLVLNANTGDYSSIPYTGNIARALQSQVNQSGGLVMRKNAIANIQRTIMPAETQTSQVVAYRPETDAGSASESASTYTLIITNGEATAQRVIVGDGAETFQLANNIPAPGAAVTIGGTFGANSLSHFVQRSAFGAIRVIKTQYGASNADFYSTGSVGFFSTNFDGNLREQKTINLSSLAYLNTFDPKTRIDSSNYLFSFQNGLDVKVPAGQTVTFTFFIQSEGSAKNMVLVD